MNVCVFLIFVTFAFSSSCIESDPLQNGCSAAECVNSGNDDRLSAILCNNCMGEILSRSDTKAEFREIQQKLKSPCGNGRRRTKLANLHADVLLIIFEDLELIDILNLIQAYPDKTIADVARFNFWRKYKNREVRIDFGLQYNKNSTVRSISVHTDFINVNDPKRSTRLLRIFGSVTQRLKVVNPSTVATKYINEYSSDSLTKLKIISHTEDTMELLSKPMENVDELSLEFNWKVRTGNVTMNSTFPKIRRLQIDLNLKDPEFLCHEFPLLERLEIVRNICNDIWTMRKYEEILLKNPQIRFIVMNQDLCPEFSNIINNHLPNLESLVILNRFYADTETRFNVKHLEVYNHKQNTMKRLSLPLLESLQINLDYLYDCRIIPDLWTDFFRNHTHMSHLKIVNVYPNALHYLLELFDELPNLSEITLSGMERISFENIDGILERCPNLEKLHILHSIFHEKELNFLREKYDNVWNIVADRDSEYYRHKPLDPRPFFHLTLEK